LERWLPPQADQPWAGSVEIGLMWYVYVLKSLRNGKLYKGFTCDLKRRIKEHQAKQPTFSRNNGPWKLIYYEAFDSEKDAREEERFLKSGKGRERLKYLLKTSI
jgi:putative endonuclease